MKLKLLIVISLCVFCFSNISELNAQHKIGLNTAPTILFVDKSPTHFEDKNYFAISAGLHYERRINAFFFLELGADLTYYSSFQQVSNEFGDCFNCNRPLSIASIGYDIKYFELDFPILQKFRLLEKNRSLFTIFTGYSPSWRLTYDYAYYFPAGEAHFIDKVDVPTTFFHTFHLGLDYQFALSDKWKISVIPAFRILAFPSEFNDIIEYQYRLNFRFLYQFSKKHSKKESEKRKAQPEPYQSNPPSISNW